MAGLFCRLSDCHMILGLTRPLCAQLQHTISTVTLNPPKREKRFSPWSIDLASIYQSLLRNDRLTAFEVQERFYEIGSLQGIRDTEAYLLR